MPVVSIARDPSIRSRSGVLLERTRGRLSRRGVEVASHQVLDLPAEDLLRAHLDSSPILMLTKQINRADGLLVATSVYEASFSGALKVLLDLLPGRALEHKVVLSFTTGDDSAHILTVSYALKPVPATLRTQEVLHGVFAVDKQIAYTTESDPARPGPILEQRLENALGTFHLVLSR